MWVPGASSLWSWRFSLAGAAALVAARPWARRTAPWERWSYGCQLVTQLPLVHFLSGKKSIKMRHLKQAQRYCQHPIAVIAASPDGRRLSIFSPGSGRCSPEEPSSELLLLNTSQALFLRPVVFDRSTYCGGCPADVVKQSGSGMRRCRDLVGMLRRHSPAGSPAFVSLQTSCEFCRAPSRAPGVCPALLPHPQDAEQRGEPGDAVFDRTCLGWKLFLTVFCSFFTRVR